MNADARDEPPIPSVDGPLVAPVQSGAYLGPAGRTAIVLAGLSLVALLASGLLWQKLTTIQELLARQSADTGALSVEARAMAKQSMELSQDAAARTALFEARLAEVTLQRTQLEELIQSLSRSRDENLVVDIESSIRLAQQQTQLTGSAEPLLAALRSADQRVTRAAQPRLSALQRAIVKDIDRIKAAAISDTPGLLVKLDELIRMTDDLVIANAVGPKRPTESIKPTSPAVAPVWWKTGLDVVVHELRGLVRVNRLENAEAALLSPEQSFFLRENLKLKLLNARLGLLARQLESSRADLAAASVTLSKYFDASSRRTQGAAALLKDVQSQMRNLDVPHVNDTYAALNTAAAGR
ncbi:uroporphyrinogen-III C-methyltransferase [Rhodoferax sp. PAMC 29310]|uniref:uroporphyrinogen-III C-methyltransferase n=1 Tax=Rhodoferax sp. PAMC 29310 TaxID=2822760 RepID=UPI001B32380E|nr:uroporphyrinogen-III C-methyltransferase [Rhodoferax sp. PAMC 29310]